MPFTLRLVFLFLLCVPEGMLAAAIMARAPLVSLNEHVNNEAPWYWVFAFGGSLYAMGFLNGRPLRDLDQDTRISRWVWSTFVAYAGAVIGMLYTFWPIKSAELYGRATQCALLSMGIVIFFSLAHIQDVEKKSTKPVPAP